MDIFNIFQAISRTAERDRLLPSAETPIGLPLGASARTEPPVEDYGNAAREAHIAHHEEVELRISRVQDFSSTGGAFDEQVGFQQVATETDDVTLEKESILQQLNCALETDKTDQTRSFLPRGALLRICNFAAVLRALQEHTRGDRAKAKRCAEYVCGPESEQETDARLSSRETFAILVLIEHLDMIFDFQEAKVVDDDLPLECTESQTRMWRRKCSAKHHLQFFQDKKRKSTRAAQKFFMHQWWVHVPFINRGAQGAVAREEEFAQEYDLAKEAILPWSSYKQPVSGANGDVRRVSIHPNHHNFGLTSSGAERCFALKILTGEPREAKRVFEQELKAFKKNRDWKHVVELCATFRVGDKCMFLFPWAEGGSLADLMNDSKREHPPSLRPVSSKEDLIQFTKWIHEQCHGLIGALLRIHNYLDERMPTGLTRPEDNQVYGVHYDIKPANILHFADESSPHGYGTLKLADFGLLKYHSRNTRTQIVKYAAPADHTYKCPEYDFSQVLSRRVDVWALGCVFATLLTWAIKGTGGVDTFNDERTIQISRQGSRNMTRVWEDDCFFTTKRKNPAKLFRSGFRGPHEQGASFEEPMLKLQVVNWIDELSRIADYGERKTFLQDFLMKIRVDMLEVEREKRIDCKGMDLFFAECRSVGDERDDYWLFPSGVAPVIYDPNGGPNSKQVRNRRRQEMSRGDVERVLAPIQGPKIQLWKLFIIIVVCIPVLYAIWQWFSTPRLRLWPRITGWEL